jgi:hypothetical protein
MSFRPPSSFTSSSNTALLALDYELAAEKADALGRAGRKVEAALAALAKAKAEGAATAHCTHLADEAAEFVWALLVQREICGFRSQADAVERYQIPHDVLIRVGVGRRKAEP